MSNQVDGERLMGCDGFKFFAFRADGTVHRFFGTELLDANPDTFKDGVKSKDITISPETGVFVRMFLPEVVTTEPHSKLPILFYVHGGAFSVESPASPMYHGYVSKVAKEIGMLCVSVNYRLCPEHRLPAAYDDCFEALRWVLGKKDERWISSHGDLGRVFLAGDSAGGNIVHEIGLRASRANWHAEVKFEGAVTVHPFFQEKVDAENDDLQRANGLKERDEFIKEVTLPSGESLEEYPPFNPVGPRSPPLRAELVYRRIMVAVAELDTLKGAGLGYYKALRDEGLDVELVVSPGQGHVFHLFDVGGSAASAFMESFRKFVWLS